MSGTRRVQTPWMSGWPSGVCVGTHVRSAVAAWLVPPTVCDVWGAAEAGSDRTAAVAHTVAERAKDSSLDTPAMETIRVRFATQYLLPGASTRMMDRCHRPVKVAGQPDDHRQTGRFC